MDGALKVWDLDSGTELSTLTRHSGWVNAVAVAPDGRRAISASTDTTLNMWDLECGEVIATFTASGPVLCCAVASNDTLIAGDATGEVHILRLEEP